jgi:transcriptional regulator with XRE-family HTH domain
MTPRWTLLLDDRAGSATVHAVPAIEPFYPELGRRIQAARERAGLSQADVARRLTPPMTRASIANMENGKQRVLCHTLVALSEVLAVAPASLLEDTVAEPAAPRLISTPDIWTELERKVGVTAMRDVLSNMQPSKTRRP